MDDTKIWGCWSIIIGLIIITWWFPNWGFGLVNDCWIGSYCHILMIPAVVAIILIVAGSFFLLKRENQ
jgi:hypothetical protein